MVIELPFPPSVNSYWRNIVMGGRPRTLISERGRQYRQAVIDICRGLAIRQTLVGPLVCTVDLYPPCRRRRDCDNFLKGLLDALTHARVYDDDSQIVDLRIRMHPKKPPGIARVELGPLEDFVSHGTIRRCGDG